MNQPIKNEIKADFAINNDEIDKVSMTIHKLREHLLSLKDLEQISQIQDEILALLDIKKILYEANIVYNPEEFVLIDQMRIKKNDYDKFFALLSQVSIEGLDIVKPLREGDFLPGTKNKIRVPREMKDDESILEYEDYLYNFYQNNGYNLPPREYVEGTTVYKVREPYIHELYTLKLTADGYNVGKQYASRNPYYRKMKRYYENEQRKALEDNKDLNKTTKIYEGAYVSTMPKKPLKVVDSLLIPTKFNLLEQKSIKDIVMGKRPYKILKPMDEANFNEELVPVVIDSLDQTLENDEHTKINEQIDGCLMESFTPFNRRVA